MPARRSSARVTGLVVLVIAAVQLFQWLPIASEQSSSMTASYAPAPCTDSMGTAFIGRKFNKYEDGETFRCSEDSEPIRHTLHIPVRLQRFYDHWVGPVNLDRQGLRISGMENYAIIAAVLLQILVGFYAGIAQPDEETKRMDKIVFEIQMLLLMAAVLCSTFTMVMFLLSKICNVTALGLYKDVSYATFLQATRKHRVLAFWSMFLGLACFVAAFALDLLRRVAGQRGLLLKIVCAIGGAMMLWWWADVMILADKHIFSGSDSGMPRVS